MINEIIHAMSVAIDAEFNTGQTDAYEIYDKEITQLLEAPAFYIQSINSDTRLFFGRLYLTHNHFVVQYFPALADGYQEECNTVGEKLIWVLEWITCENDTRPICGTNMHFEVVDGVLNFFVDYEFFVLKSEQKDMMGTLEIEQTAN